MSTMQETTTYDIEGRLLEVCNCAAICPCWVGLDPDNGTCDSILAWAVDSGTVKGVDVSDRVLGLSVHIPGNVLAGNWKAVVYVDERCDEAQQEALLAVFTGQLGGAVADLAALIGEVAAVERVPITCTVTDGRGTLSFGDVADRRAASRSPAPPASRPRCRTRCSAPSRGRPRYPGTRHDLHAAGPSAYGMADVEESGKNAVQGSFHFSA